MKNTTRLVALCGLLATLPVLAADRSKPPPPTAPRAFVLPEATEGALKNGIRVQLVESHELPFVWVTLAFTASSADDPAGKEGLAEITIDMLNEGAGAYDAVGLSAALKRLGSDLGGSVGADGGSIGIRSLDRNLGPTLDLLADVVLKPGFPASEWDILKKQYLASLQTNRTDPNRIGPRVLEKVLHGPAYRGREMSETSIQAIDPAAMRAWYETHLGPATTTILVGGDTTLAAVLPELDRRFGGWNTKVEPAPPLAPPPPLQANTLYVVNKTGAAQSVIQSGAYIAKPTDPDYFALMVANQAIGGQFSSRINLNLREKNGYTYGARSSLGYNRLGARFSVSTSVKTDVTGPAMKELLYELNGPAAERMLTDEEVSDARDAIVNAWPLRFESPGYLLDQLENIWRYALPTDWVSTYAGKVGAVDTAAANAAWKAHLTDGNGLVPMAWVVVGDLAKVREGLGGLGLTMVELDVEGAPVTPK